MSVQVHHFMYLTLCELDNTPHTGAKIASENLVSPDNGLWFTEVWISQLELWKFYPLTARS